MGNKLKPALIGGLIVGILSAACSQIPFLGLCCCLWSLGGGAVAGLMYIKGSPTRVAVGDGAMVGGLAGVVGALLYLIIVIPISLLIGSAAIQSQLANTGVQMPFSGTLLLIIAAIVTAVILVILSTLGGILSVPIFEKRKDSLPPSPPAGGVGGYAA